MDTLSANDVELFFQQKSSVYDAKIRCSIPGYEALHAMTGDFLRRLLPESANVLAVGVGTGMELMILGRVNPGWRFTAVDTSADMLTLCEQNMQATGLTDRVTLFHGPVGTLVSSQEFDAATSILVSHFISDIQERRGYFQSINAHLKAGGILITADLFGDKHDAAFQRFFEAWKLHYASAGIPPEEVEADFAMNRKVATFLTEQEYCQVLADSGFSDIRRFYQAFLFGGWICQKS
jgi:tRNA (cmo5U34)-methyltransferase